MCGKINYLYIVINIEIIERAMGLRGSKSDFKSNLNFVKEQRIDGISSTIKKTVPIHTWADYRCKVYSNSLWKKTFIYLNSILNQIY